MYEGVNKCTPPVHKAFGSHRGRRLDHGRMYNMNTISKFFWNILECSPSALPFLSFILSRNQDKEDALMTGRK